MTVEAPADLVATQLHPDLLPLVAWLEARAALMRRGEQGKLRKVQRRLLFQGETPPGYIELTMERRHYLPKGEAGISASWLFAQIYGRYLDLGAGEHEFDPLGDPDGWRSSWLVYQRFEDGSVEGSLEEWLGALERYDVATSAVRFDGL